MGMTYEEQLAALQQEPPESALAHRPGGGGMTLTYLEGYYVIDKLNEIFGVNEWGHNIQELSVDGKNVYAIVRLDVYFADQSHTVHTDVGSTTVKGSDVENAVKTAVTDGLKRAARCLGPAFGNTLYDTDNPLLASNSGKSSSSSSRPKKKSSSSKSSSFDANPSSAPDPNGPDGSYLCEICGDPLKDSKNYSAAQQAMFSHNQDGRILHYNCRKNES